ncbi:MAG: DUF885 domain-containing protein [candidate division Zixibacteria bacterium]|nr:DUF885 domain-containing protein [candidate division Zixibacteria bacterium]
MFKSLILLLVFVSIAVSGPVERLDELTREYTDLRAKFYPVWATGVGIHDYDSQLTDYSAETIFTYRNDISIILQELLQMNADKFKGDNSINFKLLKSSIEYDEFNLAKFPLHELSMALYIDEPLDGIYSLLIDNSRTMEEKAPFILARMKAIGDFIESRWEYQAFAAPIFYDSAIETVDGGKKLIEEAAQVLYEALPDSTRRTALYRNNALGDLKSFKIFCGVEKDDATGTHVIGKRNLDYLLKNIHFLDIDSDSLKKIGWQWYNKCSAAMDSLGLIIQAKDPSGSTQSAYNDSLTRDDILNYYQWEIDQTAKFFKENDIVTIPDNIGACIPVEMPVFMRAIRKGIAYQPPPAFSTDQTGYFYVRPLEDLDSLAKVKYGNLIEKRGFKGSIVHEAFPGHHLQLGIANTHPSPLRRIQHNTLFLEGWALYCEQMATEQGLFADDDLDSRWHGVYGGIRYRAVRIIVDCSLADGSMTPDSALVFMNNLLGESTEYFTAEIRRYCANPTQALSYLTGKLIILDMLEKARKKEGNSFSLKQFHDLILAEGSIPPSLIAEKLGYNK